MFDLQTAVSSLPVLVLPTATIARLPRTEKGPSVQNEKHHVAMYCMYSTVLLNLRDCCLASFSIVPSELVRHLSFGALLHKSRKRRWSRSVQRKAQTMHSVQQAIEKSRAFHFLVSNITEQKLGIFPYKGHGPWRSSSTARGCH